MVHPDNDRTGSEEQQRLEEGMGHQMEDGNRIGCHTQRHRHIAQLGQCRVGHDPLDVILDHTQEAHEQRTGRTDNQDERQGRRGQIKERRTTGNHEDTRGHHRCGVD